jgi:hypothetical protein
LDNNFNLAGEITKSSMTVLRHWITRAWHCISPEVIVKGCRECCITNPMDGTDMLRNGNEEDEMLAGTVRMIKELFSSGTVLHVLSSNCMKLTVYYVSLAHILWGGGSSCISLNHVLWENVFYLRGQVAFA